MLFRSASKVEEVASQVDFIFCAVNMPKDEIKALEEAYAKACLLYTSFDLSKALPRHIKHAQLIGRAITVLGRTQDAVRQHFIALKVKYRIHEDVYKRQAVRHGAVRLSDPG